MAVLSPAEDLRDSAPNLYFRAKYIDTQIKCFFSMPAKGIVFSRYTTNSNVCSRNLQISVRGFIHKINGNTNSNEKFRKHERDSLLTVAALACVAWRFWLGALSNKGGWGQTNREEIGEGATWKYFSRGFAWCAWLYKTAMLHRLPHHGSSAHLQEVKNNRKL